MTSLVVDAGPVVRLLGSATKGHVRLVNVAKREASSYRDLDDALLGERISARDARALEELYDRHGAVAYALARRVVVDEQLAQDVVQEVFLAIWRGAAAYDTSRGALRAWLLALAHHKAVDAVRGADRHGRRRAPEEALQTTPSGSISVEDQAVQGVEAARVRAALAKLPEPQRKALLLAYFGGYSQSEIAALTNAPLGTVKTRTLAALRTLRTLLADKEVPGDVRLDLTQGEAVWPQ